MADPGSLVAPYIWKVDPTGTVSRIAGTGVFGSTGSNGPALSAEVEPSVIAVGPQGDLYFDDGNVFRAIDKSGTIRAFAGTSTAGFSGDGGPAVAAETDLSTGSAVAADLSGDVYLGDGGNYRIREVDPQGVITTVVGTGVAGYSGDNGPATAATVGGVGGLATDPSGNLFVADTGNNVVRKIDTSGVITTVAGTGHPGFSGDCGPAVSAELYQPTALAIHDGILYIVDSNKNRVRMLVP